LYLGWNNIGAEEAVKIKKLLKSVKVII
jgi:hypothetical protein